MKLYDNIDDLPVLNYNQVFELENFTPLVIKGTPSPDQLQSAWEKIEDQVIEERLKDPDYVEELEKIRRNTMRKQKAGISGNNAERHRLDIEASMVKPIEKADLMEAIAQMSRHDKTLYSPRTMTVRMFMVMSRQIKQEQKAIYAANLRVSGKR